jgi:hypothetical protein
MQAGHYVPKGSSPYLYFDERNVHCQCFVCNVHKHGATIDYREELVSKHGEEWVLRLELDRTKSEKRDAQWYKDRIEYYTKKLTGFDCDWRNGKWVI